MLDRQWFSAGKNCADSSGEDFHVLFTFRSATIFFSSLAFTRRDWVELRTSPLDDSNTDRLCRSRCSSLYEENEHPTSSTSLLRRQTLLSLTQDKQACRSSDGGCKDIELDPSADKKKEDQQDDKEGEVDDEEEPNVNSVKTG